MTHAGGSQRIGHRIGNGGQRCRTTRFSHAFRTDRIQFACERMIADIPMHRMGRPEEVASLVVYLASEQSSYMTGTLVSVDGGVTRGI